MNRLQRAMENADIGQLDAEAQAIGADAVASALDAPIDGKAEVEAQRQRDLDGALADAVEAVARQRARLGRRSCTQHDGATVRRIFEELRGMLPVSNSGDPGFP
jgi:hypothetical protein